MRRDPAYLYAPVTLLGVQTEDGEFDEAEQTLAFLRQHHPGPANSVRAVRLAVRRKDQARARVALKEIAELRPTFADEEGALAEAVKLATEAGWNPLAEEVLHDAIHAPTGICHPDAGALWVRTRTHQMGRWWGLEKAVRRMPGDPEMVRRARLAYMAFTAEFRNTFRLLRFLRRMRRELRADTASWAQVGYALTTCRLYWQTARWLADWRERTGVEAWMLFNLATSLRALGRDKAALAVNQHALTLPPDQTRQRHATWVALENALSDDPETYRQAAVLHAESEPRNGEAAQPYRYLRALTGHLLAIRGEDDPARRRRIWRGARVDLRKERRLAMAMLRGNRAVARAGWRARRRLAREAGVWWARLELVLLWVAWIGIAAAGIIWLGEKWGWF